MEISPREPNKILEYLANALRSAQEFGNKAEVPYLGLGLGDLFMGDAQDAMERMSYGESLLSGSGQTTQVHPGSVDLAGLASIPASMVKRPAQQGMKRLASSLRQPELPVNPRQGQLEDLVKEMSPETRDLGIQAQNRAVQERDFPTFQPRPRQLDQTVDEMTSHRAQVDRTPSLQESKPIVQAPAVQTDMGRRDFLKMMGLGAAGVGIAASAPKMLATALKAGTKTVAKGTAPAVAKGVVGSLTKSVASKHIVMDMMSDMLGNFSYANLTRKQFSKMLDENPQIAGSMEKELKEWGIDSLDGATEGVGQRITMAVPENATDMTGLVKGTKEQAKEAMDLLNDLEPEVFTKWKVTGKWPKKYKDTLKHLDMEDFEGQYDMPTTEKLFYDLHDKEFIEAGGKAGRAPKGGTNIIPLKYYE